MTHEEYNRLSGRILDCCITVHKEMGPGLLESVYEWCLMKEFELREIHAAHQVMIPLRYKGFELEKQFRVDILVEKKVLMEIKSVEKMLPVYEAQIISYLKHSEKKLGFLVNFNVPLLKKGFKRFVNNF
ncbi:MAG: GxxExxY protein [bacterium]|nr:GxxExxY protein [bacterium]